MLTTHSTQQGFSLIEMLIVVVIMGILASIAVPSYEAYVTKSRRSDGIVALLNLDNKIQRYYTENNSYSGATLSNIESNSTSPEGYYTLQINSASASAYSLSAIPQGIQATKDTKCATFSINQLGQQTVSGSGSASDCW